MDKTIQEREQKPECAMQEHGTEGDVAEGRRELAHLIGSLLARRWVKQQCPTESSTHSTGMDDGSH